MEDGAGCWSDDFYDRLMLLIVMRHLMIMTGIKIEIMVVMGIMITFLV